MEIGSFPCLLWEKHCWTLVWRKWTLSKSGPPFRLHFVVSCLTSLGNTTQLQLASCDLWVTLVPSDCAKGNFEQQGKDHGKKAGETLFQIFLLLKTSHSLSLKCLRGSWRFWVIWPLPCCQLARWGWVMPKGCPPHWAAWPAYIKRQRVMRVTTDERWEFPFIRADLGWGENIFRHFGCMSTFESVDSKRVWFLSSSFLVASHIPMWFKFQGDNECSGLKS